MNADLRKKYAKTNLKDFFKKVFRKTMENVRKHRDIKLVISKRRQNHLVSEPKYHAAKLFLKNLLAMGTKNAKVLINKPVCLGRSI